MILEVLYLGGLLLILYLGGVLLHQKYSPEFRYTKDIPGPPPLPIIGNLFELMKSTEKMFLNDRKRSIKYFPIYKVSLLNNVAICVLLPEDIELIINNMKNIKKSIIYDLLHPWLGTGLLTSEGEKWQTRRKLLTPAFHFTILQEFIKIFHEETKKLVQDLERRVHEPFIDVIPPITELTLQSILETSMGTKLDLKSAISVDYKKGVYDFGRIFTYRLIRPWLHYDVLYWFTTTGKELRKVVSTLHSLSQSVIKERSDDRSETDGSYSSRKRKAMLDLLLDYKAQGADIDYTGIREEVDTFIFEGHDTTSAALCFILLTMANHAKIQEEMYQEIVEVLGDDPDQAPTYKQLQELTYMGRCLKECLRLFPSVPFISRQIGEDVQTSTGYLLPKGTVIHIHIYDVHRNPHIYPDPEKFDPDRFLPENTRTRHPYAYIPFSAGPRSCIGQRYAMLELKTVLCGILRKFVLKPYDKISDMVYVADLVLRTTNGIKIKFAQRHTISS